MGGAAFVEQSKEIFEDDDWTALARLTAPNGTVLIQSDFSSGMLYVYDYRDPQTLRYSVALTVASVIFNSLQQDGYWDKDSQGYNFRFTLPFSDLETAGAEWEGGHDYRAEFVFQSATWGKVQAYYRIPVRESFTHAAA
jgi:hypothetical protein